MDLLIKSGILLKRYHLPWRPSGWEIPAGWTPDDAWMQQRADALLLLGEKTRPASARELTRKKLERDYRENPWLLRHPWPGWIPVGLDEKDLQRAYRELVSAFNPGRATSVVGMTAKLKWPPDGRYEYANGRIAYTVSLSKGK